MKIFIGPHEVTPEDLRNIHLEIDEPGEELEAVHITVKGGRLHIKPSGDAAALTVAYDGPASPGIIIGEYEGSGYHAIYDLLQVMRYNLPDERVVELYKLGWELSTYAAAIHWDGSRNTREYLNGLRLKINAYQEAHKALFEQAALLKGLSLTDFMVSAAYEAAVKVLADSQIVLELGPADSRLFFAHLLNPREPAELPTLQEAIQRYQERMGAN